MKIFLFIAKRFDLESLKLRFYITWTYWIEGKNFLFRAEEPASLVRDAVETELTRQLAARTVDEALTTEKVAIQEVGLSLKAPQTSVQLEVK